MKWVNILKLIELEDDVNEKNIGLEKSIDLIELSFSTAYY